MGGIMKYWLSLVAIVVVMVVVAIIVSTRFATVERRFQMVREGMSREEVLRIMGPPDGMGVSDRHLVWRKPDPKYVGLVVDLDEGGFVTRKSTFRVGRNSLVVPR
jgi:hypothetical protein